jgi:hypothetical protein
MEGFVTIDTLYLHVKYPKRDIFDLYNRYIEGVDTRMVKEGCIVGNFVVRNGSCGYKLSVWQHDARAFITDQVDEKCGEGRGMGIWVQLGPKFLLGNIDDLQAAVYDFLIELGIEEIYPISVTRIDIAIDCLGLDMKSQDVEIWKMGWVGRSKLSKVYYNSRTGLLESLYVGSRKSPIMLRVYDKVAQAIADGDYLYWLDVWEDFEGPVTRLEWEIKTKDGNFSYKLTNFEYFDGISIRELMNYLLNWGRFCITDSSDTNRNRWEDSPLWSELREFVANWSNGVDWPTSRYGKEFHGISEAYMKFLSGAISGGIAKTNPNNPNIKGLFEGLDEFGETLEKIHRVAEMKARRIKRL